jgi:hypothetical protein
MAKMTSLARSDGIASAGGFSRVEGTDKDGRTVILKLDVLPWHHQ